MKVLFVIHTPADPNTAVYSTYLERSEFMKRHGFQTEILTPSAFRIPAVLMRLLPLIYPFLVAGRILWSRDRYRLIFFHSYAGWVVHRLRFLLLPRECRTITTYHGLEPIFLEALKLEANRSGKKLSLRFRLLQRLMTWLMRDSTRRSDWVHCLNSVEREYLITHAWADRTAIRQIPNGVSPEFFQHPEYPERTAHLLFVGQWLERKGIRYLVQAFDSLSKLEPSMNLICVGTLLGREEVLQFFPEELRNHVSVIPSIGHQDLPEIYHKAHIFVFPSLFEGFSKALLEAMASGLPVVTTPVGSAPDMIRDGKNGILVPVADSASIVQAILKLSRDRTLRMTLGLAAQQTARAFMTEKVCRLVAESIGAASSTAQAVLGASYGVVNESEESL